MEHYDLEVLDHGVRVVVAHGVELPDSRAIWSRIHTIARRINKPGLMIRVTNPPEGSSFWSEWPPPCVSGRRCPVSFRRCERLSQPSGSKRARPQRRGRSREPQRMSTRRVDHTGSFRLKVDPRGQ